MSKRTESIQTNTSLPNPSQKWLEWDSKAKGFRYWDSEAKEQVKIKAPLKFIFLAERSTVIGFHSESNSRIYSNDVQNVKTEALRVASKAGLLVNGYLADIKDKIEDLGGKNAARVYAVLNGELVNFVLAKSFRGKWIDFCKAHPRAKKEWANNYLEITGTETVKKGGTTFNVPIFGWGAELTEGEVDLADQLYDTLDEYFTSKNNNQPVTQADVDHGDDEESHTNTPRPVAVGEGEDDLPF